MNHFAKNLVFLRKRKGINQSVIARLVEKRQTAISSWEKENSQPDIEDLLTLCDYFSVTLSELVEIDLSKHNTSSSQAKQLQSGSVNEMMAEYANANAKNEIALLKELLSAKEQLIELLSFENERLKKELDEKNGFAIS